MNRFQRYRFLRQPSDGMGGGGLNFGRRHAFVEAFVPIRPRLALHVLRGRPLMYRVELEGSVVIRRAHTTLAESTIYGERVERETWVAVSVPISPTEPVPDTAKLA